LTFASSGQHEDLFSLFYNGTWYVVLSIGNVFQDCDKLTSLSLPGSVTSIPDQAFSGCTSLESLTFGDVIPSFGQNVFNGCNNLKSVYINDLNPWLNASFTKTTYSMSSYTYNTYLLSNPLENGADLYVKGEKLVNLVLPDSIDKVKPRTFVGCTSIESLSIPKNIETINGGAFSDCVNLKNISFESSIRLMSGCFSRCTSLEQVIISDGCTLEEQCFGGCENLKEIIFEGDASFGYSDASPFYNCNNVRKITLPRNVVESDAYVSQLIDTYWHTSTDYPIGYINDLIPSAQEIVIPEGTTKIGRKKFYGCTLSKINIPSSVKVIGNDAFSRVDSVYIDGLESWCDIQLGAGYWSDQKWYDADPRGANPLCWSDGASLFVNGEKLVNCTIPDGITRISDYLFKSCTSIESLSIPNSVASIGENAFMGCRNLQHVVLPDSQIEFGQGVLSGCDRLISVGPLKSNCSIEYGWTKKIPDYAFYKVPNLKTVIIPSTIDSIGRCAFYNTLDNPISTIYSNATNPPVISGLTFSIDSDSKIFVPRDCSDAYLSAEYWQDFNIIELVDVESLEINQEQYDVFVGDSLAVNVTVLPAKATYKELYWTIEDQDIAVVNDGVVTGVKTGTTKLTATTTDGTNLSASCTIRVTNPVLGVTLSKYRIELEAEETDSITAYCLPANADDVSISWRSLDTNVATITKGFVTAVAVGETEVVATSANGIEDSCKIIVKPTLATSILLSKHTLHLTTGKSELLVASILPIKVTSKSISWSSSNPDIISVDEQGLVKALATGTATITASTTDGSNLKDECTVSVTTLATDISFDKDYANLIVGQSMSLCASILPSETSNKNITWESNNVNCATVSADGIVNALATGTATITASTTDGSNMSASCTIIVTNPVISLTLDKTSAEMMAGQQITIHASVVPSNADDTNITWSSSDDSVASVENGVVTAKRWGIATVTASSATGVEATCSIVVLPTPVSSMTLNRTSLEIARNESVLLVCTIFPEDASNKELEWYSMDEGIAMVNEEGVVTGVSSGETTIIVESKSNSKISASCSVKVFTPVTDVYLDCRTIEIFVEDEVQINAICTPLDADNTRVLWTSSNSNIADVDSLGFVTTKREGTVAITVSTTDGTNLSASCSIKVNKIKQSISWDQDFSLFTCEGEMVVLDASSSSTLPVSYTSSDNNVVSIIELGNVVYANPISCGTAYISAYQAGNYKYESVEVKKELEVKGNSFAGQGTLVAYYSKSKAIDGIVAELAAQIASSKVLVNLFKVEPVDPRLDEANYNEEMQDSIMCAIEQNPHDIASYPDIKSISIDINDYDCVIMVYPLWNSKMAAPMQTFQKLYIYNNKRIGYIEYDLNGNSDLPSNSKVLRMSDNDMEDKSDLIRDWLNSESTGILPSLQKPFQSSPVYYDLQGRIVKQMGRKGVYIRNGSKVLIK